MVVSINVHFVVSYCMKLVEASWAYSIIYIFTLLLFNSNLLIRLEHNYSATLLYGMIIILDGNSEICEHVLFNLFEAID